MWSERPTPTEPLCTLPVQFALSASLLPVMWIRQVCSSSLDFPTSRRPTLVTSQHSTAEMSCLACASFLGLRIRRNCLLSLIFQVPIADNPHSSSHSMAVSEPWSLTVFPAATGSPLQPALTATGEEGCKGSCSTGSVCTFDFA